MSDVAHFLLATGASLSMALALVMSDRYCGRLSPDSPAGAIMATVAALLPTSASAPATAGVPAAGCLLCRRVALLRPFAPLRQRRA